MCRQKSQGRCAQSGNPQSCLQERRTGAAGFADHAGSLQPLSRDVATLTTAVQQLWNRPRFSSIFSSRCKLLRLGGQVVRYIPWFFSGNGIVSLSLLSKFRISFISLFKQKHTQTRNHQMSLWMSSCKSSDTRNNSEMLFWLGHLSMFSMSVPTSHWSCRKSMGEEDLSSRMGTSELSSILKSKRGSESLPAGRRHNESPHEAPLAERST